MLTLYDWVYGIAQLTAVFLSIIAGFVALSLIKESREHKMMVAWKYLIFSVVFFAAGEIFGALESFGIHRSEFATHVLASLTLVCLIAALSRQVLVNKGWVE